MVEDTSDLVAGFSVWAIPAQPAAKELKDIINAYAERLATPSFLPHMTVLSGRNTNNVDISLNLKGLTAAEATAKLSELADSMCALDVEIETVAFKDLYFQCVFGLLKLTPDLQQAHNRSKEIYAVERNDAFMPHVSFIYGDLANEARAELAKELRPQLNGKRLKMEKLQLWRTLGQVETWELLAEVNLSPAN